MKCLFEEEVKTGKLVCDYGGMSYAPGVEECPTAIFNLCQATDQDYFVPETLDWCKEHYVPPCTQLITCRQFGDRNGMDGGCWWCMEMYPYQWHMCGDEQWVRGLMSEGARFGPCSRSEAVEFIDDYKQRCAKARATEEIEYE